MSTLNSNQKEKTFEFIRKYLAYRMTNDEILSNLKEKGFEISERTLRRYKQQIRENAGSNLAEIYHNEVVDNTLEDFFTIRELQRQAWQEYDKGKSASERIKALNLIRNSLLDKSKLYLNVPLNFRHGHRVKKSKNILTDIGDDSTKTQN